MIVSLLKHYFGAPGFTVFETVAFGVALVAMIEGFQLISLVFFFLSFAAGIKRSVTAVKRDRIDLERGKSRWS